MGGWIDSLWIPKITISTGQYNKAKKFNMKYTEASKAITAGQEVFCYLESANVQKVPLPKRYVLTLTLSLTPNLYPNSNLDTNPNLLTLTLSLTLKAKTYRLLTNDERQFIMSIIRGSSPNTPKTPKRRSSPSPGKPNSNPNLKSYPNPNPNPTCTATTNPSN